MTCHGPGKAAIFMPFIPSLPATAIPDRMQHKKAKKRPEPAHALGSESLFIILSDAADFARVSSQKLVEHSNDDPGPGGNADQPGKRMDKARPSLHLFDFLFLDQLFHLA